MSRPHCGGALDRRKEHPTTGANEHRQAPQLDAHGTAPFPADLAAEAALLGAALLNADAAHVTADVPPGAWLDDRHRAIAAAITALAVDDNPVDPVTVADRLRTVDRPGAEWLEELTRLMDAVPAVSVAPSYAAIIERHHRHRTLASVAHELATAALFGDDDAITRHLNRLEHVRHPADAATAPTAPTRPEHP